VDDEMGHTPAKTEQLRLDFIRTDLNLLITCTSIAETEFLVGNRERAERTLAEVEEGYSRLILILSQAGDLTAEEKQ
jgi:hypothetical protein